MKLTEFSYQNVWKTIEESALPVVLYGMGNCADKVLDELSRRGVEPAGVMASDGFCRYQMFRGYTVQKESDFEREYGDFLLLLCFGSSLPDVTAHIDAVAQRHPMLVPNIPVAGDVLVDDGFIERYREEIYSSYSLLADDQSRKVFQGALDFYYTGRLGYLREIESEKDEAFREILRLKEESYLDLGAYRGDTVEEFLRYTDGYKEITAVEPNPKNHQKLCDSLNGIANARAVHAGIADRTGVMTVSRKAGRMPTLGDENGVEVPVLTVDSMNLSPTYIKADIEGMESEMLKGAENTLRAYKPKLNLAAYHRSEDVFKLVLQLHAINPDYRIYLRKHPYIPCWDLNIYAV